MIAYKGFRPGLICRGYQFVMGLNTTEKANCRENGFHCAEDPLDCLSYYSSLEHSEYYIVNAGGDIDEDEHDSKIACTELTVIKRLTKEELFLHGLAYMVDHPAQGVEFPCGSQPGNGELRLCGGTGERPRCHRQTGRHPCFCEGSAGFGKYRTGCCRTN